MLADGLSRGRSSLEELVLLNTAETSVEDVTFLLLSGLRVFRATMRRPLAEEVLRRLATGKDVPSFGALEEVEVGLFGQEVFSSGACTGGLNPLEDQLVDSAGVGANLRRLRVFIGGAGGHVYHERVWKQVRKLLQTFSQTLPWQQSFLNPEMLCLNLYTVSCSASVKVRNCGLGPMRTKLIKWSDQMVRI